MAVVHVDGGEQDSGGPLETKAGEKTRQKRSVREHGI